MDGSIGQVFYELPRAHLLQLELRNLCGHKIQIVSLAFADPRAINIFSTSVCDITKYKLLEVDLNAPDRKPLHTALLFQRFLHFINILALCYIKNNCAHSYYFQILLTELYPVENYLFNAMLSW